MKLFFFFFYISLVESCHSNHATGINFLNKTHGYCFKLLTTLFRACHVTLNGLVWSFTKLIIKSWNFAKTNYKQKIFVFSLYQKWMFWKLYTLSFWKVDLSLIPPVFIEFLNPRGFHVSHKKRSFFAFPS